MADITVTDLDPKTLAAYFDHTLLKAQAPHADYEKLCREAVQYGFASVMVHPAMAAFCKKQLGNSGITVGTVAGFPLGMNTPEIKYLEALNAIDAGAGEIDYVINITELKEKNYSYIQDEMARIVEACHNRRVITKVIFENCYLNDDEKKELCRIARTVGIDFIKTSTGFGSGGAAVEDVKLMKSLAGDKVKVKAAGGIRDLKTTLAMINAGASRIGASAGAAIIQELVG
ncbi:deoxyribose-phosphate aldolase [Spirochaetia bacterium]|nr:deoxyribose-phosphate aldolase [Spirochaetia bacterium]